MVRHTPTLHDKHAVAQQLGCLRRGPTQEQMGTPSPMAVCTPYPCPGPAACLGTPSDHPPVTPPTALTASPGCYPAPAPLAAQSPRVIFPPPPSFASLGLTWHRRAELQARREGNGEAAAGSRGWRKRRRFRHCFSSVSLPLGRIQP